MCQYCQGPQKQYQTIDYFKPYKNKHYILTLACAGRRHWFLDIYNQRNDTTKGITVTRCPWCGRELK